MNPKNWYKECGDSIRAEFGSDAELFIDLLAATSPRKQVAANWRMAMRIYHVWKNREVPIIECYTIAGISNLFKGVMKTHKPNVVRALKREPLSGNKVRAFAANLKGNMDEVTIDVWVCRYYGWTVSMNDKLYNHRAEGIRLAAKIEGMKPAEYQAMVWYKAIRAAGKKPQSYLSICDKNQMYFEWYLEVT